MSFFLQQVKLLASDSELLMLRAMSHSADTRKSKEKEGVFELAKTFFYAILLALIFRSFLFEPFHIPSGSMRSTLLEGDYLFVSKYSYGYSKFSFPFSLPLFEGRIWRDAPERGDVVVFRNPEQNKLDFIKRLIGLPGDRVQVVGGEVFINGEAIARKDAGIYFDPLAKTKEKNIQRYTETLSNGKSYQVLDMIPVDALVCAQLITQRDSTEADFSPDCTTEYRVPEGHYFMLGDNRDDSVDSRFEGSVGMIPEDHLIGRAEMILFSVDTSKARFWELWKWPSALRSNRFFVDISE